MKYVKHSVIFIIPLLAMLLVEAIHRANMFEVFQWTMEDTTEVLVNYLLYFALFNIFYIMNQKLYLWISFVIILSLSLIAFISQVKIMFRGVPIHPSDFKLLEEAFSVREYLFTVIDWKIIVIALIIVFSAVYLVKKIKMNDTIHKLVSITLFATSIVIYVSLFTGTPIPIQKWGNIHTYTYAQSKHYDTNGLTLGFFLLSTNKEDQFSSIAYTKENVEVLKQQVESDSEVADISPNVLYIMSESFWDPTIIRDFKLEKDPIPFYRQLKEESIHGELVVPVFGGNTGNSEFEALTGMSLWFLGGNHIIPFNEGIEQPVDSMASILTRQGYVATAMHPFNNGYYNRIETYRELGFQNYIPPEYMYSRERRGAYVSDETLMKQILDTVKNTEQPVFIHAVTMENHGPYHGEKYKEHTISVNGPLTEENKLYSQDYIEGLVGADSALKYLVNELKNFEEPTVVVFFGDHMPYLGKFDTYLELGFTKNKNLESHEDFMKMHTTPFLIWSNFEENKDELRMSSNYLTPYVLDLIQKEGNTLTDYLQGLIKQGITVTPPPQFNEVEGITEDILEPYKLLQHDSLTGDQFSYNPNTVIEQPDYHLGFGKILLEKAWINNGQIEIQGEHFVPSSKVYINGNKVETEYINPERLRTELPKESATQLEIQVIMIDEWTNEILERTKSIRIDN